MVQHLPEPALLLLIEGIEDARNLGFTLRSAEALGAHAVLIKKHLWDFDAVEVARPASGAYERLPLVQLDDIEPLKQLQRLGLRLLGCIAGAKRTMHETDLAGPAIVAIGGGKARSVRGRPRHLRWPAHHSHAQRRRIPVPSHTRPRSSWPKRCGSALGIHVRRRTPSSRKVARASRPCRVPVNAGTSGFPSTQHGRGRPCHVVASCPSVPECPRVVQPMRGAVEEGTGSPGAPGPVAQRTRPFMEIIAMDFDTLPSGQRFAFWDDLTTYRKSYHVAQKHPKASDQNPGTADAPFLTINAAARVLQPGQKVVVHEGIYRECIRPARGGSGSDQMIAYEAAAGERGHRARIGSVEAISAAEAAHIASPPPARRRSGWPICPRKCSRGTTPSSCATPTSIWRSTAI